MGENATYTTKMSVRHILIIVTGIMITVGCSALVFSTWSAFQAVVPEILGVEKATWAFYVTILYLASAFSAPFIGKCVGVLGALHRKDLGEQRYARHLERFGVARRLSQGMECLPSFSRVRCGRSPINSTLLLYDVKNRGGERPKRQ